MSIWTNIKDQYQKAKYRIKNRSRRVITLLFADIFALAFSYIGALYLFRPQDVENFHSRAWDNIPIVLVAGLFAFIVSGLYRTLWRYASINAIYIIVQGTALAVLLEAVAFRIYQYYPPYTWTKLVVQWMLLLIIVGGGRFSIRIFNTVTRKKGDTKRKRILIYGAGDAGEMIARDIQQKAQGHNLILAGFIDDDPTKKGAIIHNARIFGGRDCVAEIVAQKGVEELVVAMPSLSGNQMRELLSFLKEEVGSSVELRTLPGVPELINGEATLEQARHFSINDLLRRKPVELDIVRVRRLVSGKSVLISGAGGSIGSEICRQVASCIPSKLIIVDISEPNLYLIHEELSGKYKDIEVVPVVADICHRQLMERMFDEHAPTIVFHAAAYKHVPLMESNPWSAVMNNIVGTRVLSTISAEKGVDRFVMISTDKAVRPSSMMGATKRLCELCVSLQDHKPSAIFSVVRFGNVMGSSGSVIPKFERQIKAGGPVTVTHQDVTRYFMLTSEAVQLVLQAATLDKDDAIYILDMGEPVKIDDLARDMIRLSGLEPDIDIEVQYTGLRPGEKLYEELCHEGAVGKSEIDKILNAEAPDPASKEDFYTAIDNLLANCYDLSRADLYRTVARLVPDFGNPVASSKGEGKSPAVSSEHKPAVVELKPAIAKGKTSKGRASELRADGLL